MSSSDSSSWSTSTIVGTAIGGLFLIITIVGILVSCYQCFCKKNNNPPQVAPYPPQYYHQNPYGQPMNAGYYPQQNPYYAPKPRY